MRTFDPDEYENWWREYLLEAAAARARRERQARFRICAGRSKSKGGTRPCRLLAAKGSAYCSGHDPANLARAAAEKADRERRRAARAGALKVETDCQAVIAILDQLSEFIELPLHSLAGGCQPTFSEAEVRAALNYLASAGRVELSLDTGGGAVLIARLPGFL